MDRFSNSGRWLFIDDQLVVEATAAGQVEESTGAMRLDAGRSYPIRIEFACDQPKGVMVAFLSTAEMSRQTLGLLCELGVHFKQSP